MGQNQQLISHNNIFKQIFFLQTILITFFPYLNFDNVFIPILCLSINLLAFIVSIKNKNKTSSAVIFISIFCLIYLIAAFNSTLSSLYSSKTILLFSQLSYFFLAFSLIKTRQDKINFASLLISLVTISSLYALWQYFIGYEKMIPILQNNPHISALIKKRGLITLSHKKISAFFTNKNIFSSFLLISTSLFLLIANKLKNNKFLIFICLCNITTLLLTKSRSAIILSTTICLSFYFFKTAKTQKLILIIVFIFILLLPVIHENINVTLPDSLISRINYYKSSYKIIKKNLMLGAGIDSFQSEYISIAPFQYEITKNAHNYPLEIAVENGIPSALIIFIMFVYILFIKPVVYDEKLPLNMPAKRNDDFISIYSYLTLACFLIIFQPFSFYLIEFSAAFSIIMMLFFILLNKKILKYLASADLKINHFFQLSAILIFTHGFIDISMDKFATSLIVFGLTGIITNSYFSKKLLPEKKLHFIIPVVLFSFCIYFISLISGNHLTNRAYYYAKNNNSQKAIRYAKLANAFTPFKIQARLCYAELYLQKALIEKNNKHITSAISYFQETASYSPKNYLVWQKLANILIKDDNSFNYKKTILKSVKKAHNIVPNNCKILLLYAKTEEKFTNYPSAIKLYQKIINLHKECGFNYVFTLNSDQLSDIRNRMIKLKKLLKKVN